MEIKIQSFHVDTTEKLETYINKKVGKLSKHLEGAEIVEVQLKLVKPQSALNKVAVVTIPFTGSNLRAEKTCDTFEEAIDKCVDVLKVQIEKLKNKNKQG